MYRYDEFDATLVAERVAQFRGQVGRRLSGELTEDQFKPLRLMNGLYLQLHAYMLRVAIPYGTFSSKQMRKLAYVARKYDRGYGHFTTRQNIQYNWPALVDVPDLLDDLAEAEMHAIQTSGNCIRNVTSDQYAGAAVDEVEDPRPYAEMIRQWSTFHPEFSFLPRKFKIAVTASEHDRAAVKVHDIGLRLYKNSSGKTGFEVIVGGGLGRTPYVGHTIREFLPKQHLLSYLEAILRVYNLQGRRDNLYKARIKILVNAEGAENFSQLVEDEWSQIKDSGVDLPPEEMKRINAYFSPPSFEALPDTSEALEAKKLENSDFARWVRTNTSAHKIPGYAIVNISLKPIGGVPGDITDVQMETVANIAEEFSFDEIRATHEQNLVLPHIKKDDLFKVWLQLMAAELATANIGLVSDIIACPGLDYCTLANTRSIPIAQRISERFADLDRQEEMGELKIKISGCINACGHHHVGHIGILGVDKKGEEFYQITLGGSGAEDASLGEIAGRGLSSDQVVDAVEKLVGVYREKRQEKERFLDTYRRLGAKPFKEALYEAA
ncbi:nitrite/sulfite reductase [Hyphococcus flavus]|uniref:Nitrite/sulfite reductase n=1 Tax=Hyphococcus flavus TaxID=1866326 RepID=A0AAF0CG76_9PROT|nr:nitrite/sulfite reductase [Hyphococcus flavus]WDI33176.1 nitrite/sulfite reductase [Hyphococcus flavus]